MRDSIKFRNTTQKRVHIKNSRKFKEIPELEMF